MNTNDDQSVSDPQPFVERVEAFDKDMRRRYPGVLARMQQHATVRDQFDEDEWPDWCWMPMGVIAAAIEQETGPLHDTADLARVAAVTQWRLLGRHVVMIDPDGMPLGVPLLGRNAEPADMDVRLDRAGLVAAYGNACYYLANPLPRPDDAGDPTSGGIPWADGIYVHLEWDIQGPVGSTELRLLFDTDGTWTGLVPYWLPIDQPSLAMAMHQVANSVPSTTPDEVTEAYLALARTAIWWAWPFVLDLANPDRQMHGPVPVDGHQSQVSWMTSGPTVRRLRPV